MTPDLQYIARYVPHCTELVQKVYMFINREVKNCSEFRKKLQNEDLKLIKQKGSKKALVNL